MNQLNRQWFYIGFHKKLRQAYGKEKADEIWKNAADEYARMIKEHPDWKKANGNMVLPAAALYKALPESDRLKMLCAYGNEMGGVFASAVHCITGIPGISGLIWKNIAALMDTMSSEKHGYRRNIVSEPPFMYGVDILSCPYHELAKQAGCEEAVLCICHMDKAYMQGFQHIRYERSGAVSEGDPACDYRLHYDK